MRSCFSPALKWKRAPLLGLLIIVASAACVTPARAVTEFCPASLNGPFRKTAAVDAVAHYYHLQALSPRSVSALIIAETDRGWFSWTQPWVPLTRMTYAITTRDYTVSYVQAESPELSVTFPEGVNILRAWVAVAQTQGDQVFGWGARGEIVCDPPDFGPRPPTKDTVRRAPAANDPTPAPRPPPATATRIASPFPNATCQHPFVAATVINAVSPVVPDIVRNEGFSAPAISEVYVAIDRKGAVQDAWMFGTSGYPALDSAAIAAAKKSSYKSAVSYCRPVTGLYVFRADFLPR